MENKCLKTQIYMNETIVNETGEVPVDIDFTMPDYYPDIVKILKCRAVPRISSKSASGKKITVDGSVCVNMFYSDENGHLNSFEYQYLFTKNFECNDDVGDADITANAKCEYMNCRAITSRKADIHGAVSVRIKAAVRRSKDIITDYDDKNIELNRGTSPATSPMGCSEKYLLVDEDIELGETSQSVRTIIRYDAVPAVKECKIMAGKTMVKGDIEVTVLCCMTDSSTQTVRSTVPFSQMLETENANESCECTASVQMAFLDIKPRSNASGDTKSLQMNAKLCVCCETYCNNDVEVVLDAYSRKYSADIEKCDIVFNKIHTTVSDTFTVKTSLDFADGNISNIVDMWCEVGSKDININADNMTVSGTVTSYILAYGDDNNAVFCEKESNFEHTYSLGGVNGDIYCDPQLTVKSCNYTITSSSGIDIRIELCVNAPVCERNNVSLITDISVDENKQIEKTDRGALTIYFASGGEKIWDIARKYRSSTDEIKTVNEISEDVLQSDKMIFVPIS